VPNEFNRIRLRYRLMIDYQAYARNELQPFDGFAEIQNVDFALVIRLWQTGWQSKASRSSWNASGQFVVRQAGYPNGIPVNHNTALATGIPEGTICKFRPYLMLYTAQGDFVPWVPTVSDILATDWTIEILERV